MSDNRIPLEADLLSEGFFETGSYAGLVIELAEIKLDLDDVSFSSPNLQNRYEVPSSEPTFAWYLNDEKIANPVWDQIYKLSTDEQ